MGAKIRYIKDRMTVSELKCDCGCQHNEPFQDIYVGKNLLKNVPQYIKKRDLGKKCVLAADANTYEIAGRTVERYLRNAGFDVTICVFARDGELEPDEAAAGELLMSMDMGTEFFVSVGSGTVTDTVRIVAAHTERPFVCVGTAPSMDGYTSVVAPLLMRGVKVNLKAVCPEIIVCDLDILRTAPLDMFISGVGDVLGKYIAKADWVIGNIINGEDYCPMCGEIVINAVNKLLDNIDEIKARTEEGTRILIEALLLAGLTIMIIGTTRAVASVEHNIAHYWEMQKLLRGEKPASHGQSVGVATVVVWPYYEKFSKLDIRSIDINAALEGAMGREERIAFMLSHYGERAAQVIMAENESDFLSRDEHARRIAAAEAGMDRIVHEISLLPSYERIIEAMRTLGAPVAPEEIGVDGELLTRSVECAKDYRSRYTLFKTLDELGIDLQKFLW